MLNMKTAAETAIKQCMNLKPDESCVIVTDAERYPIGKALFDVANEITAETTIVSYPPGQTNGAEPPASVAAAMAKSDVVLAPTTKSLTHTRARTKATEKGARVATLPGITEQIFTEGLDVNYNTIAEHCQNLRDQVDEAETVRVKTDLGTDITFTIGDREFMSDTGIVHESGQMSNLPAGEVAVGPTSADGTFVVDGTMMPHGLLKNETLTFEVVDGFVEGMSDDRLQKTIDTAAESVGKAAYNIAELGIGANVAVNELTGSVLLDEKAAGTVHIAIGDDVGMGGDTEAPIHLDGVIRDPTVYADGEKVTLPTPQ
ncbi:aminopeptidase [Natronosalvus halobius]|uniref:aminopeptidase n=1 Tax=Natronosalvus halobius TaxID=2953746 RepID=UPI0020A01122|nr:aminopeptidase [Natronosalvus halobius]USZ73670.1 aminopeptidase [Natronosalvus halobius]